MTDIQGFYKYGAFAAKWPVVFVIGSFIFALILLAGFNMLENEDDGLKLWLPRGTEFKDNSIYLADEFEGDGTRMQTIQVNTIVHPLTNNESRTRS